MYLYMNMSKSENLRTIFLSFHKVAEQLKDAKLSKEEIIDWFKTNITYWFYDTKDSSVAGIKLLEVNKLLKKGIKLYGLQSISVFFADEECAGLSIPSLDDYDDCDAIYCYRLKQLGIKDFIFSQKELTHEYYIDRKIVNIDEAQLTDTLKLRDPSKGLLVNTDFCLTYILLNQNGNPIRTFFVDPYNGDYDSSRYSMGYSFIGTPVISIDNTLPSGLDIKTVKPFEEGAWNRTLEDISGFYEYSDVIAEKNNLYLAGKVSN